MATRRTAKTKTAKRGKRTARPKAKAKARPAARKARPAAKRAPARRAPAPRAAAPDPIRVLAQRIIDVTLAGEEPGVEQNDDAILALYADDAESIEAGQPPTRGHDALRSKYAMWRGMVSQSRFEPRRVAVDGNVIVIEWLGKVTLAGSGREAELHEIAVHEIADGKIVREAFFYNPAALA